MARRGRPAVALVTEAFRANGAFVAAASGMPDVPCVVLPHPVAGRPEEEMARIAGDAARAIVRRLRGGNA